MELFDDPTIKKLMAEDEKILRDYKIDWLPNVLNSVDSYQVFLGCIDSLKRRLKNAIRRRSEDRKSLARSLREAENYIFVVFPEFLDRIGNPDIAGLYEACRKIKDYRGALSEVEDSESNKISFINYTSNI